MIIIIIREKLKFDPKYFILNSAIYLLVLLSLIYSEDLKFASKKLETMASLIVFPFLFSFFSRGTTLDPIRKNIKKYLLTYILAILLLNLVFFSIFWLGEFSFSDTMKHYLYLIDHKLGKYSIHAIYMSMHICVAILCSLYILIKSTSRKLNYFLVIVILLQLFFLLILNRKGPIISLLSVISFYIFYKGNLKKRLVFVSSVILLAIIVSANSRSREQFKELLYIKTLDEGSITSTNIRYTIYINAWEVFKKKPILGYGLGDSKNKLLEEYKNNNMLLFNDKYNTHNQYLSLLLSVGILGFLLILLTFYLLIQKAFQGYNYLFVAIFAFYLIEMFSENILERESGVIFYSFFVCLLQIIRKDENVL